VSTEEQQDPSLQISGLATCTSTCQACGLTCMDYMGLSMFFCKKPSLDFAELAAPDPVHMILYGKIHGVRRRRSQRPRYSLLAGFQRNWSGEC